MSNFLRYLNSYKERIRILYKRVSNIITPFSTYVKNTFEKTNDNQINENNIILFNDVIVEIVSQINISGSLNKKYDRNTDIVGFTNNQMSGENYIWCTNFPKKEINIYLFIINSLDLPKGSVGICKEAWSIGHPEFNIERCVITSSYSLFFREDINSLKIKQKFYKRLQQYRELSLSDER